MIQKGRASYSIHTVTAVTWRHGRYHSSRLSCRAETLFHGPLDVTNFKSPPEKGKVVLMLNQALRHESIWEIDV
jgi:hypothetical protein